MSDTDAVLEAVARALRQSPQLSDIEGVHTRELDLQGVDSEVRFPLIEVQPISEVQPNQSISFVEYVRDGDGNAIGEIYEWLLDLRIQIDIWTIAGSDYDAVDMSTALKMALFQYDRRGYDALLPDGEGDGIADINLRIGEATTPNTRSQSGGTVMARRWRQDVHCQFTKRVSTVEQYGPLPFIETVEYPMDGDYHSADGETVEAHAPYSGFGQNFSLNFGE